MNNDIRKNETKGSVDERLLILENSLLNRWDKWFSKNPGVVLGIVVVTLFSGGWVFYTWQIERVTREYESRISWLKEQNALELNNQKDRCSIELKKIGNKLEMCNTKNITKVVN
jgi:hypothetical protein